jgi:hypothetical protein
MFLKYGDVTTSTSVEDSSKICENCGNKLLIINDKIVCKCSEDSNYKKSSDFFTQKKISTNLED